MRWLKRDIWKAGIALAGLLLLLVLMVRVPVSEVGAYEGTARLATSGTATVQATPTEDATVTALNKEKLIQDIQQLKNQNDRSITALFWNSIGLLAPVIAALLAVAGVLWTAKVARDKNLADSRAGRKARKKEQLRWLKDQEVEREKRSEERFQKVVEGLGSERIEARVGAAITLRTFLQPGYERFYGQVFDLAVAHLRLRKAESSAPGPLISPPDQVLINPEESLQQKQQPPPSASIPLDPLSQALITIFKLSFPLAREELKKRDDQFEPQLLDAANIRLDNAYLVNADLAEAWLERASLRKANLSGAHLEGAHLSYAHLEGAHLEGARLGSAQLKGAHLEGAHLSYAHLEGAHLEGASLQEAFLTEAHLEGAHLEASLQRANLVRASLQGADLSGAYLQQADLSEAHLEGANLKWAHLEEAYLGWAHLRGADLEGAHPEEANALNRTKMSGVKGLRKEQLKACEEDGAIIDEDSTPAQGSAPTPETGGSSATSSKSDPES